MPTFIHDKFRNGVKRGERAKIRVSHTDRVRRLADRGVLHRSQPLEAHRGMVVRRRDFDPRRARGQRLCRRKSEPVVVRIDSRRSADGSRARPCSRGLSPE